MEFGVSTCQAQPLVLNPLVFLPHVKNGWKGNFLQAEIAGGGGVTKDASFTSQTPDFRRGRGAVWRGEKELTINAC